MMTDSTQVVVMPMRFTVHMQQMGDFLSLLGFSRRVSRSDSWTDFGGASGLIALHSVVGRTSGPDSGHTSLLFEVSDADALAARFADTGCETSIYDEAYGRVVRVSDHDRPLISFDEQSPDLYGFQVDEPEPQHGVASMPVQFGPPAGEFADLLALAGFARLDEGDDQWWRVWRAGGGGLVALHPATEDREPGSVRLGLRTREPLPELADRLRDAGFADVAVSEEYGGELTVTDPDGQSVLVQPI